MEITQRCRTIRGTSCIFPSAACCRRWLEMNPAKRIRVWSSAVRPSNPRCADHGKVQSQQTPGEPCQARQVFQLSDVRHGGSGGISWDGGIGRGRWGGDERTLLRNVDENQQLRPNLRDCVGRLRGQIDRSFIL